MNPQAIALVFVGAGAGGVLRFALSHGLNPLVTAIPLGTLAANVLGSGAAGAIATWLALRTGLDEAMRPLLLTGFLGGLTTFSTFTLEVVQAIEQQRVLQAAGIALLHVGLSLGAAIAALVGVRALLS